jgi:hypothetical protein
MRRSSPRPGRSSSPAPSGGIGGKNRIAPLCDRPPPIPLRWPEHVETPRGRREWVIPTTPEDEAATP